MTMRERIAEGKLFTDYCEGLPEDQIYYYKDRVIDKADLEKERELR